jgi:glycosyltransferase involved in cell wall biosynthesis
MNICFVNAFFHPYTGGTEKHMYELGKRVAKKQNLFVITSQLENTKAREEFEGMHMHRVPARFVKAPLIYPPPLVFAKQARREIERIGKEEKIDIFNLHGRWFPDFAYSAKYANDHHKLFIQTIHNARPVGISPAIDMFGTFFDNVYGKKILKRADRLIAVSRAVREDISLYGIDKKRIKAIHNGVDTDFFKPSKPSLREELGDGVDNLLLFVGRIVEQKGLPYTINAMKRVVKEYPSTRLAIVGRGKSKPALQHQVKKEGLENNVVFPGFIPEEQLPNLYSSADVFLLPSLWEVLPIALVEALSCGSPLLVSDAGGNPEVAKDGENGFVFEKKNEQQLIEKLRIMVDDAALRSRMGKKSREIAEKEFDWDIITRQTLDFYAEAYDDFYNHPRA